MEILKGISPERVFTHFETLTKIPRGSGNEKAVSDYLVKFASNHDLEVFQDKSMNVIIKKPASRGYENSKTVILQGHMDMVCVKQEDLVFDFSKDALPIYVDGDFIRTKGTTLGADNGIAVAMAMAILESKTLPHPPLIVLITVEEETGMGGVLNLEEGLIKGDILINLDSEEEGIFLASCAGGARNIVSLPIQFKDAKNEHCYEVNISGLLGGHSGIEINKNRANAIKLIGRLLEALDEKINIDITSISGGEKMNAIAKSAKAIILIKEDNIEEFNKIINEYNEIFKNEYKIADPNINITVKLVENNDKILSDCTKKKLINILRLLPFGVQTMSASIAGLVESSVNIGIIEINDNKIIISSAIRSSVKTLKAEINKRIKTICDIVGAKMNITSSYPEWEYKINSPIRELMLRIYEEMYGKKAEVKAIHAGLECGFLKEKIGDIDMISMGPNMYDVHTPNEHLSISSTKRVYEFLLEVLKQLK